MTIYGIEKKIYNDEGKVTFSEVLRYMYASKKEAIETIEDIIDEKWEKQNFDRYEKKRDFGSVVLEVTNFELNY